MRRLLRAAGTLILPRWRLRSPGFIPAEMLRRIDRRGILLIHIPKTAGTSLTNFLYGEDIKHRPAFDVAALYPLRFLQYFKVAVAREPLDRFLSAYDYLKQGGTTSMDARFCAKYLSPFDDVNDFVAEWTNSVFRRQVTSYYHFQPQVFYVTYAGRCIVDRLVRFERLEDDLSDALGQRISLPARNVTDGHRTTVADLSAASRASIMKYYHKDRLLWSNCTDKLVFGRRIGARLSAKSAPS